MVGHWLLIMRCDAPTATSAFWTSPSWFCRPSALGLNSKIRRYIKLVLSFQRWILDGKTGSQCAIVPHNVGASFPSAFKSCECSQSWNCAFTTLTAARRPIQPKRKDLAMHWNLAFQRRLKSTENSHVLAFHKPELPVRTSEPGGFSFSCLKSLEWIALDAWTLLRERSFSWRLEYVSNFRFLVLVLWCCLSGHSPFLQGWNMCQT